MFLEYQFTPLHKRKGLELEKMTSLVNTVLGLEQNYIHVHLSCLGFPFPIFLT